MSTALFGSLERVARDGAVPYHPFPGSPPGRDQRRIAADSFGGPERVARDGWTVFMAPLEVVQFLLDRYPQALAKVDNCGLLALHMVAKASKLEVVELLVDRCPRALMKRDDRSGLPVQLAVQSSVWDGPPPPGPGGQGGRRIPSAAPCCPL